jgi:prepilin-type processing-associated H-X9-DG protein
LPEATYVPCPHCGHAYPMSPMQKELYRGRTLSCNNCAKPFSADNLTPVPVAEAKPWAAAAPRPAAPPPTAVAPPARRKPRGWLVGVLSVAGAAVLVLLLMLLLLPPLNRARESANRVKCMSNMRLLGQAMMLYANVNAGQFPDTLDKLLPYAGADVFVCPSCAHTPAPGTTPQIQASNLYKGGHLSYVYTGAGLSTNFAGINPATKPVLYEPLANHADGINVLYADGSVAFLPLGAAQAMLGQQKLAGQPVTPPTSQPAPAPAQPAQQAPGNP